MFSHAVWPHQAPKDAATILEAALTLVGEPKEFDWLGEVADFGDLRRMSGLPRERFDAVAAGLHLSRRVQFQFVGIQPHPINPDWLVGLGPCYFAGFRLINGEDSFSPITWDETGKVELNIGAFDMYRQGEDMRSQVRVRIATCPGEPPADLLKLKEDLDRYVDHARELLRAERYAKGDFEEYRLYLPCAESDQRDRESDQAISDEIERRIAAGLPLYDEDDGDDWGDIELHPDGPR